MILLINSLIKKILIKWTWKEFNYCKLQQQYMEIEIFADETYIEDKDGNKYLGIGCLFIPTLYKKEFSEILSNFRCLNEKSEKWTWEYKNCENKCNEKYHNINNCEIHYSKKVNESMSKWKLKIYEKWIKFIVNHNKRVTDKNKLLYFKILYLDLRKLNFDIFGVDKDTTNIYNRFFRTMILSANAYYFDDCNLKIENIFHDDADEKKVHEYFNWHTINFLKKNTEIEIITDEIKFISSNQKDYNQKSQKENAQLIQLIDLILGCSNQILFQTSKDKNKLEIASKFYKLFERLWNHSGNFNSSYNYYKKQDVSIFPKVKITEKNKVEPSFKENNQFHRDLEIINPKSLINQTELDEWINIAK